MELCDLTAHELTSLLKQKKASAVEILESSLRRIGEVDGRPGSLEERELTAEDRAKVHAFITVSDERALAKATEVDAMIARGEDPGPLAGVPFSVKDIFCVKGTTTTAASRILSNFTAPYTATPVARMEKAGAVMIGKVNLDEFTFGSSSESSAYRPTPRNPWKTDRVPGGSSGGSAASVAAGEVCTFARHRHGGFDPPASRFLRRGGAQTHLRTRFTLRLDRVCLLTGLPRSAGA